MTFGIKNHGVWNESYPGKETKSGKKFFSTKTYAYFDLDETLFKNILKDELDVPDYAINAKNINKEFGFTGNGREISADCVKHIVDYYKWRKGLFKKICGLFLNKGAKTLLDKAGCDELTFKYRIPAKYNNFSTEELDYTGGQVDAYMEVTVHK